MVCLLIECHKEDCAKITECSFNQSLFDLSSELDYIAGLTGEVECLCQDRGTWF